MSNRNFNKQVTQSRKPLAHGGPSKNKKVVVNKTQKGGSKRTKSMMDSTRAKSLGLK